REGILEEKFVCAARAKSEFDWTKCVRRGRRDQDARRVRCCSIRESVLARRQSPSSPRRVFDRTGIVNSSRASRSRKSVSASSRNPQAGSPRSPEEDPAAATGSGRASRIEKLSCIGSRRHQSATTKCNGGEGPLQRRQLPGEGRYCRLRST